MRSLIVHEGDNFDGGHYFSVVRVAENEYYIFNDNISKPIQNVFEYEPYILIYEKIDNKFISSCIENDLITNNVNYDNKVNEKEGLIKSNNEGILKPEKNLLVKKRSIHNIEQFYPIENSKTLTLSADFFEKYWLSEGRSLNIKNNCQWTDEFKGADPLGKKKKFFL